MPSVPVDGGGGAISAAPWPWLETEMRKPTLMVVVVVVVVVIVVVVVVVVVVRRADVLPVVLRVSGTGSVVRIRCGVVVSLGDARVGVRVVGAVRFRVETTRNVAGTGIFRFTGTGYKIGHDQRFRFWRHYRLTYQHLNDNITIINEQQ